MAAKKAEGEEVVKVEKKKSVLKNVKGEEVPEKDYFYAKDENGGKPPIGFEKMCGKPVEREDILEVFNKVFKPEDNILFYKTNDKEVYLVIIPLKYSTSVGDTHESVNGDFQKHALSFLQEGSVNLTTLRMKLQRILNFVNFTDR